MIPWLLVTQLMSVKSASLSSLVEERVALFPCSGEINREVEDAKAVIALIEEKYKPSAAAVDFTDGLSMSFEGWRFNVRMSNTEPVVRLNVESDGDFALMEAKTAELLAML